MYWKDLWLLFLVFVVVMIGVVAISLGRAHAYTCDDAANTCTYLIEATEPTKKINGAALDNYKQTNLKVQLNGGAWSTTVKPATAPIGGGAISQSFTFATSPCAVTTFMAKASGVNLLNIEGPDAAPITVTRDRTQDPTCAPMAPAFSVK